MRIINSILLLTIVLISSCSPTKQMLSLESDLSELYQQGQYEKAVQQYDKLRILSDKNSLPISDAIKLLTAKAAHKAGDFEKSTTLFKSIENLDDTEGLIMGGVNYEKSGLVQEELSYWSAKLSKFEGSDHLRDILLKIYRLEQQLQNYTEANETWAKIDHQDNPDLMFEQVTVLSNLDKTAEALALCNKILKVNRKHERALFWKADYYYNKAENWYQSEMAKYNRDANYTTYAYLRRELKKISANYRTARDLLNTLHDIAPENKKYIGYLINTFIRLDMKNEADQMTKKLNAL